ncbi:hypothetical protein HZA33_02250 [Candidatus Pacearchaeota archaeon]|nr:hypothetical protein [Candidatus Pacearchaeota archaeon]
MPDNFFDQFREKIAPFYIFNPKTNVEEERNIEVRQDPLFLSHSSALSPQRAERPFKPLPRAAAVITEESCFFCPGKIFQVTPTPRRIHGGLVTFKEDGVAQQVITVPNLYPFAKPHWVTVFSYHKPDLRSLTYDDMVNYFESSYEIGKEIKEDKENCSVGFWAIINWGELAGASQPHPHGQEGGICEKMITDSDKEILAYQDARRRFSTSDPFELYLDKIRDSELYGWENDHLFIYAPFAPRMSDQVNMVLKPSMIGGRNIRTILDLEKGERENISKCMLGVFHVLREKREVTDLNVILHQQRFNGEDNYRVNWHIYPRNKSLWGGMEMNNHYVVDVYPETTAAAIRNHYNTWWWKQK